MLLVFFDYPHVLAVSRVSTKARFLKNDRWKADSQRFDHLDFGAATELDLGTTRCLRPAGTKPDPRS